MKKFTVYGIQLKSNGAMVYVGLTGDEPRRRCTHRNRAINPNNAQHYNLPLYQMIRKHGLDSFRVVEICTSTSRAVAAKKEIKAIKALNAICNVQHNKKVKK